MSTDVAIWVSGIAFEAIVIFVLLYRHVARLLPVFFILCIWNFATDVSSRVVLDHYGYASSQYFRFFLVEQSLEAVVQFAVLVELAWSVLRPYRSTLSPKIIWAIAGLVLIAGLIVWPFTGTGDLHVTTQWAQLLRLQQTTAALRILVFLALAALSQLLAIGWRHRELQVATGLGMFSLITLGAIILHSHHATVERFHAIDTIAGAGGVFCLIYWTVSFMQSEAPRQEFTPRMQNLLLSVAGSARSSRVAIDDLRKGKS